MKVYLCICEKAKIKQYTFSKKELCEIGEEALHKKYVFDIFSMFDFFNNFVISQSTEILIVLKFNLECIRKTSLTETSGTYYIYSFFQEVKKHIE